HEPFESPFVRCRSRDYMLYWGGGVWWSPELTCHSPAAIASGCKCACSGSSRRGSSCSRPNRGSRSGRSSARQAVAAHRRERRCRGYWCRKARKKPRRYGEGIIPAQRRRSGGGRLEDASLHGAHLLGSVLTRKGWRRRGYGDG